MFDPDHFVSPLPVARAEALFKKEVKTLEISISSFCNRRCPYCPNAKVDRISQKHQMRDALFLNILRQLCKIEYDGSVHINRFNEPLADREYALRRIREIKAFLPSSSVIVFTNGDYLDASYVQELGDAGVSAMLATVHEATHGTSFEDLLEDQDRRLLRLGLPFEYSMSDDGRVRTAHVEVGTRLLFNYMAQDFHRRDAQGVVFMEDRGQSLELDKGMVRTAPCFMPFTQMQIEWDGELLPCCQIQPDAFARDRYSLGRLTEQSNLFVEWTNTKYVRWRSDLFSFDRKNSPCSTCSYGGPAGNTDDLRTIVAAWREALGLDAGARAPEMSFAAS